jgi:hypothetical protein
MNGSRLFRTGTRLGLLVVILLVTSGSRLIENLHLGGPALAATFSW